MSLRARDIEKAEHGVAGSYRIPDNPAESALANHTDAALTRLEDQPGGLGEHQQIGLLVEHAQERLGRKRRHHAGV